MTIQHPNFCRQFLRQYTSWGEGGLDESAKDIHFAILNASKAAFHLASRCQKFLLPDGGRVIMDMELRALDDALPLRLPYPDVALEYFHSSPLGPGEVMSTKRIIFATEYEDMIMVLPVSYIDQSKEWIAYPEVALPLTGYLDRSKIIDGCVAINFIKAHGEIPDSDYLDEISALLCFLNALRCKNVHIELSKRDGKPPKTALPFDDYRILTVSAGKSSTSISGAGQPHRSPREHLRRGHIRTFEDRSSIWVNAAIVNAGKGFGKIFKDYRIRP